MTNQPTHATEDDAVLAAARALLATASRGGADSATAQVNAAALDRLRAAVTSVTPSGEGNAR